MGDTTPVGVFQNGASPYGCLDMAGNVWEWCGDWYDEKEQMFRVLRGGSWDSSQGFARCAVRLRFNPFYSYFNFGFRVVSPNF